MEPLPLASLLRISKPCNALSLNRPLPNARFYAFRVPEPPADASPASSTHSYRGTEVQPEYVLLISERTKAPPKPAAPAAGGDDCCKKQPAARSVLRAPRGYGGALPDSDSYGRSDDDDEDDDEDGPGYGGEVDAYLGFMAQREKSERFGTPLLVPFPCGLSGKGPAAEAHLREVRRH